MKRKGMGKGQGKGYKNMVGKDPMVHSQSAKGMKQPQRIKDIPMQKKVDITKKYNLKDTDGDGVADVIDCRPLNPNMQDEAEFTDVSKIGAETKTEAFGKRLKEAGTKTLEFGKKEIAKFKEKREKAKIKELEEIDHPTIRKLESQKSRVAELESQIATNTKPQREEKLFDELHKEQEQLRQVQEKVTELDLSMLSDAELKTLAIRHPETGFLADFFGSGKDKYTTELVRRIKKKEQVERDLQKARDEAKKTQSSKEFSLFDI